MSCLVDQIEAHLRWMLAQNGDLIEMQRSELAERFGCVPSQINYVLATRFSAERGYLVESRRGGGGYIRITRLRLEPPELLRLLLAEHIGEEIDQRGAMGVLSWLESEDLLSRREADLLRAVVDRDTLSLPVPERDRLRARILRASVVSLLRQRCEGRGAAR